MMTEVTCLAVGMAVGAVGVALCGAARDPWEDVPNPHARMLGRVVEARPTVRAPWERCVVVAVSWKGALRVRPLSLLGEAGPRGNSAGRWVDKDRVAELVREVGE